MRAFRMAEALWERFGDAAKRKGTTRGDALRAWVRWYVGDTDEQPERPERDGA